MNFPKFISVVSLALLLFTKIAQAQSFYIPDVKLRAYLNSELPGVMFNTDEISIPNANGYAGPIEISGLGVTDISGMEHFISASSFDCSHNNIGDLSAVEFMISLQHLDCSHNQIVALPNLENVNGLFSIKADHNQIASLSDFPASISLEELFLNDNQLTTLWTLTTQSSLRILDISRNPVNAYGGVTDLNNVVTLIAREMSNALPNFSNMNNLRKVIASGNVISDLSIFSSNQNLDTLELDSCTFLSLNYFPELHSKNLDRIFVRYSNINFEGVASLPLFIRDDWKVKFNPLVPVVITVDNPLLEVGEETSINITLDEDTSAFTMAYTIFDENQAQYSSGNLSNPTFTLSSESDKGNYTLQWFSALGSSRQFHRESPAFTIELKESCPSIGTESWTIGDHVCGLGTHVTLEGVLYKNFLAINGTDTLEVDTGQGSWLQPGIYDLAVSEGNCFSELPGTITIDDAPLTGFVSTGNFDCSLGLPIDAHEISLDQVYAVETSSSDTILLDTSATTFLPLGTYTVYQESQFCNESVGSLITVEGEDCSSVFSPDGDGQFEEYFIEGQGNVEVKDLEGNVIRTIGLPGSWDGRNDSGTLMAPGIYFLIFSNEEMQTVTLFR